MKLKEIEKILDNKLQSEIAESWDNVGLLIGDKNREVESVLLTLELTDKVFEEALAKKCDMILAHHPLIFSGVKRIVSENDDNLIYRLIEKGIPFYAAHTNFDAIHRGLNDYFAEIMDANHIEVHSENEQAEEFLRIFDIEPQPLAEFVEKIKNKLHLKAIRLIGARERIAKVGVVTGAGGDYAELAHRLGADAFITGDIKYHQAMDFKARGICVIDVGHFETEQIFAQAMKSFIQNEIPELKSIRLEVAESEESPFVWM
ncbi:MAG: Nif3-like dinuclear metal center hexameric protein [Peptostreptococcaceae bacterium]|nr:Nif3-like dinuclear metal center hexameric protein [Peptostreptococcaceae bacterium]